MTRGALAVRTAGALAALVLGGVTSATGAAPERAAQPAAQSDAVARPIVADDGALHWPSFRGPRASGLGAGPPPPATWEGATGRNILWKTPIPGLGLSSPVIWGDRLFVTTAVGPAKDARLKVGLYGDITPADDEGVQSWRLYCLDRTTGAILWERTAREGKPRIRRHPKSSHANPTPATDGRHVAAFFGSEGLYLYDMEGRLLWKKDLGVLDSGYYVAPEAQWGFGSSPILHDGRVIVQADVQGKGFLAAFDVEDGREIWRTARADMPTWSTPTAHVASGRAQVIVNGHRHAGAYDLKTGKELWRMKTTGDIPVPTPVTAGGLAFITNAHGGPASIYAVRLEARGDVSPADGSTTSAGVAWSAGRDGAYMQTPLVLDGRLHVCRDNGTLTVLDAATGGQVYQTRLGRGGTGFTASAVAAAGRIYYTSETCETHVLESGPEFKLIATNAIEGICMATPAIAGGVLYVRTAEHVIAIGVKPAQAL